MDRARGLVALALAAILAAGCAAPPVAAAEIVRSGAPRAPANAEAGKAAARAVEALAVDLHRQLGREPKNLVYSPYSVAVALAMTRAGAAGLTAEQIDRVLHASIAGDLHAGFNALEQELGRRPGTFRRGEGTVELELATANRLFGQKGYAFEPAFLDRLAASYGAGMHLLDYTEPRAREAARRAINGWVSERTKQRIPELIADGVLNQDTRLVLTNAIYLKAKWVHPFPKQATQPAPFHRLSGGPVEAPMMRTSARLHYGRGAGYEAVALPYHGGLSMVVVVPEAGRFPEFEVTLGQPGRLRAVLGSLRDAQVQLGLPKFEFRTQASLKRALSELGMPVAFTERADFSGMAAGGNKDLMIQDVVHEAFIAVDEDGTEAAAATAVVMGLVSAPLVSAALTVDRPFLFLIRDDATGAVLFMGRVLDPTQR